MKEKKEIQIGHKQFPLEKLEGFKIYFIEIIHEARNRTSNFKKECFKNFIWIQNLFASVFAMCIFAIVLCA